jgi:hypothetical protein
VNPVQQAAEAIASTEPSVDTIDESASNSLAMAEIARLFEALRYAERQWDDAKDLAKERKAVVDAAQSTLLTYIGRVTAKPADLPLFNQEQREADQQAMEAAAQSIAEPEDYDLVANEPELEEVPA